MRFFDFFKKNKSVDTLTDLEVQERYQYMMRWVKAYNSGNHGHVMRIKTQKIIVDDTPCDLLTKKQIFIDNYATNEELWRYVFTRPQKGKSDEKFRKSPKWCKKWRDYEQAERLVAHKKWQLLIIQRQKFMNQKTR